MGFPTCGALPRRLCSLVPLGLLMYLAILYVSHAPSSGLVENQYAASSDSMTAVKAADTPGPAGRQSVAGSRREYVGRPQSELTETDIEYQELFVSPGSAVRQGALAADEHGGFLADNQGGLVANDQGRLPGGNQGGLPADNRPAEVVWADHVVDKPSGVIDFIMKNSLGGDIVDAKTAGLQDGTNYALPIQNVPFTVVGVSLSEKMLSQIDDSVKDTKAVDLNEFVQQDQKASGARGNDFDGYAISGINNNDVDFANDGSLAEDQHLMNGDDAYKQPLEPMQEVYHDLQSVSTRNAGRKLQASRSGSVSSKSVSLDVDLVQQQQQYEQQEGFQQHKKQEAEKSSDTQSQLGPVESSNFAVIREDTKLKHLEQPKVEERSEMSLRKTEDKIVPKSAEGSTEGLVVNSVNYTQQKDPPHPDQHEQDQDKQQEQQQKLQQEQAMQQQDQTKNPQEKAGEKRQQAESFISDPEATKIEDTKLEESGKTKAVPPEKPAVKTDPKATDLPKTPVKTIPKKVTKKTMAKKAGSGIAINYLKSAKKVKQLYEPGFTVAHPDQCVDQGRKTKLLAFITSAPAHSAHRTAIRQTWGSFANRKDITMVFMVGQTSSPEHQAMIDHENRLFADVIQSNNVDCYQNLTLKTAAMFEWAKTYCPKAAFVLKTDDDMFINMPLLLLYIDSKRTESRAIFGKLAKDWKPIRNKKSKYYVDIGSYSKSQYPDFLTGPAYLFTSDIVTDVYNKVLDTDFFFLEDVFVTGVISEALKIRRVGEARFRNERIKTSQTCKLLQAISIHMVKYEEQFKIYEITMNGQTKCKQKQA